jgi:hypothetical protein
MQDFILTCPHCKNSFIVEKINCAIFRHAVYKNSGKQIDPHASQELCNQLIITEQIYGCGKPMKVIQINNEYLAIECDYI